VDRGDKERIDRSIPDANRACHFHERDGGLCAPAPYLTQMLRCVGPDDCGVQTAHAAIVRGLHGRRGRSGDTAR
jgi:hypothetical protein